MPGLNRPGNVDARLGAVVRCFNEARAESPGKCMPLDAEAPPDAASFNEARAESPGKSEALACPTIGAGESWLQ